MILSAIVTFVVCYGYTLVRYAILGPVASTHASAFLLNKAIALASVVFMLRAAFAYRQNLAEAVRAWGTAAFHAGYAHILISLALLSEPYHPVFFDGQMMSLQGEMAITFGTLAAYGFWLIRRNRSDERLKRILKIVIAVTAAGHVVSLGSSGWVAVADWHGGLPPISLISLICLLTSGTLFLIGPRGHTRTSRQA